MGVVVRRYIDFLIYNNRMYCIYRNCHVIITQSCLSSGAPGLRRPGWGQTNIMRYHCLLSQHGFLRTFSIDISPALLLALNCFWRLFSRSSSEGSLSSPEIDRAR